MGRICRVTLILSTILLAYTGYKVKTIFEPSPAPVLDEPWWGSRDPQTEDETIKPFKISVSDKVLQDLKKRLNQTRPLVPPLENVQHDYGLNTKLLAKILDYWRNDYDWKEREKFLNQFPQYTVSVQGLRIHYLHVKPKNTQGLEVRPLLILHGWPGSVREFYELIPILTTPQKGRKYVFEVIAPSLPGYGFSEPAVRPGLGPGQIAVIFKNLMNKLGFQRYYVQGGDWGGVIVEALAILFPEKLLGVHSNMCFNNNLYSSLKLFLYSFYPSGIVDKKNEHLIYPRSKILSHLVLESGYMHLQATKPDTIGAVVNESPAGLAAYLFEKFITWTNPKYKTRFDGGLEEKYGYTKILDNVMIYWITNSMTTSMRLYSEAFNKANWALGWDNILVHAPYACARFSNEVVWLPDSILKDRFLNLVQINDYEGGHFAALEVPQSIALDLHEAVEKFEKLRK